MNTLILDGSHPNDPTAARLSHSLQNALTARGWPSETITLHQQRIGPCAGDFYCWVRNPGVCNTNDDNRLLAAKFMQARLVIMLTPVTFGGFSSQLKRLMDHLIQNVSPHFTTLHGETHHQKRYPAYPATLFAGWMPQPNPQAEAIFHHLARRVSTNTHAPASLSYVIQPNLSEEELMRMSNTWLDAASRGQSTFPAFLATQTATSLPYGGTRRAVLLVGSPRTAKSTSHALGGHLMQQLEARGMQTQTIHIHTSINSAQRTQDMLNAVQQADLLVLASPLYVDSLPAPVIRALEKIASQPHEKTTRFAAIANCGFPEAQHNQAMLAICAQFASEKGFAWQGGLSLGGGEGLVHGTPLNQLDGRAIPIRQALNMAAEALAQGMPIPQKAIQLLARPIVPAWLYRFLGTFGWEKAAKKYGRQNQLNHQPYQKEN